MSHTDFETSPLFDLFRLEVETHTVSLSEALLALESGDTSPERLESAMRAAHSIKGAARVVGVDIAVGLAHAMEDCMVAAQEGKQSVSSDIVDLLFRGTDMLKAIGDLPADQVAKWSQDHQEDVDQLAESIRLGRADPSDGATATSVPPPEAALPGDVKVSAIEASGPEIRLAAATEPAAEESKVSAVQGAGTSAPTETTQRVVRVSAENLERLMSLSGESLIASRRLRPFLDSLHALKSNQAQLSRLVHRLIGTDGQDSDPAYRAGLLSSLSQLAQENRRILGERMERLEAIAVRSEDLNERLYREAIASRMRPVSDGFGGFPRFVRDVSRSLGKNVRLEIIGATTPCDRDILDKLESPLTHLLRNAIDHGLETPEQRRAQGKDPVGRIRIEASHRAGMLSLTVSDDGRGVDVEKIRAKVIQRGMATEAMAKDLSDAELIEFLFLPGFTTAASVTEHSGRGVGLDAVAQMVTAVKGVLRATSEPGKGMRFSLLLPNTLSVLRAALVEIGGESYAFPLTSIDRIVSVAAEDVHMLEERQHILLDGQSIGLIWSHQVLQLEESPQPPQRYQVVVLRDRATAYGVLVDAWHGERSLVVRPLDPRLGKVPNILAAAILDDGTPTLILDVEDLIRSIDSLVNVSKPRVVRSRPIQAAARPRKRILVVDDSITVREVQRRLLENNGYEVDVAVDGADGWNSLRGQAYDLIISDVDMPRMNGIELVTAIKRDAKLRDIPVMIVSYKDREEDRLRGLEAGANYYLTKSSFHDNTLVSKVIDLIGEATE